MKLLQIIIIFCFFTKISCAQTFDVYPLGVRGGSDESNLSCYAVAAKGKSEMVCLDAGTVYSGIRKCIHEKSLQGTPHDILKNNIKGYLISHPHLDHVAGLVLNSPDDSQKNIYGMKPCLRVLKEKYFSWSSWANFGDDGEMPRIGKYHYVQLDSGLETSVSGTEFGVKAYSLSHVRPQESTAFLIQYRDSYLLYLGDTGADAVEKSNRLNELWNAVAPLIKTNKLKAIFIEVSFPSEQPDSKLFGHLTPKWLKEELSSLTSKAGTLRGVSIVITHQKPVDNNEKIIRSQLESLFDKKSFRLIFPEQGKKLSF